METFLRVFGKTIALALERVDVNHHGFRGILHLLERGNERFDVVALFHIQVVEPKCLEIVVLALALRGAEFREACVKAAVVLGDGHFGLIEALYEQRENLKTCGRVASNNIDENSHPL